MGLAKEPGNNPGNHDVPGFGGSHDHRGIRISRRPYEADPVGTSCIIQRSDPPGGPFFFVFL